MNSIDVRMEKANAMFRYRNIQRITTLFRFMEICIFIVLISTFSSQLPFSVRIFADHFRGISFKGFSHKFVFVIGNVIILILLFKYRVAENGDQYGKLDVYDEYVKRCEKSVINSTTDIFAIQERKKCRSQSEKLMKVDCDDSQSHRKLARSVTEREIMKNVDCCGSEIPQPEIGRSQSEKIMDVEHKDCQSHRRLMLLGTERKMSNNVNRCGGGKPLPEICRSQSEKLMRVEYEDSQSQRKLARSVTERNILKNVDCGGSKTSALESCGVDELSSEAFRRTVEAFIARQQRSLRDEELAPVPYVGVK